MSTSTGIHNVVKITTRKKQFADFIAHYTTYTDSKGHEHETVAYLMDGDVLVESLDTTFVPASEETTA